jgi:transposase
MPYIGWDWGHARHAVAVVDEDGRILDQWIQLPTKEGYRKTIERLQKYGVPSELRIAIETSQGSAVDTLLSAGFSVVQIPPTSFAAARARWGTSRAKSDPGDSYRLADFLRTDGHRFPSLTPIDGTTRALRELTRMRKMHVEARTIATNRLWSFLQTYWPGAATLFSHLHLPIARAFLQNFPTPAALAAVSEDDLQHFLGKNHYSYRRASAVLEAIAAATPPSGTLPDEVLSLAVISHVAAIEVHADIIAKLEVAMDFHVQRHPKAHLLIHLPRCGLLTRAQLLAEVAPILERAESADVACAEIGASPVTTASCNVSSVHFRRAANPHARDAAFWFAENSRHESAWAKATYAHARKRGKRHPTAIRILARGWVRVLWRCWHTMTPYNPALHASEQRYKAEAAA